MQCDTIEEYTHVYTFWRGFSPADKARFGALFQAAVSTTTIVVVDDSWMAVSKPDWAVEGMRELGFGELEVVHRQTGVKLVGGGGRFTATIFRKPAQL
jgi:hypothetical protein